MRPRLHHFRVRFEPFQGLAACHVKRSHFSPNFKCLSYKQQPLPARVATLSQHLSCASNPSLGASRQRPSMQTAIA
jgi:hypothetical protein